MRTEELLELEIEKTYAWDSTSQAEELKRQRAGASGSPPTGWKFHFQLRGGARWGFSFPVENF